MIANKKREKANRIPVRFLEENETPAPDARHSEQDEADAEAGDSELSPEGIGRASGYEDETEVKRRIDRGAEEEGEGGRERADDADAAGTPRLEDLPEQREDRDESASAAGSPAPPPVEKDAATDAPSRAVDASAGPLLAELLATRAELKRVEAERAELFDKLARRQADFDNYRKRIDRERSDSYNRVVGDVVANLLPVLDNLRRALDTESSMQANESEEFRHFLQGVELIYKQLSDALEGLGLQPIAAVGEPFDPHVHEAIATEHTSEYEPDTVIQEIVRGYRLGDKLLRPAMVKVATK